MVLVDDLPIMRASVRRLLEHAGMTVVAETGNAEAALAALTAHTPDVIAVDLRNKRIDAVALVRRIRQQRPATQVVVYAGGSANELVTRAVEAGATSVPDRDGTPWELLRAIDRAYRTARNAATTEPAS